MDDFFKNSPPPPVQVLYHPIVLIFLTAFRSREVYSYDREPSRYVPSLIGINNFYKNEVTVISLKMGKFYSDDRSQTDNVIFDSRLSNKSLNTVIRNCLNSNRTCKERFYQKGLLNRYLNSFEDYLLQRKATQLYLISDPHVKVMGLEDQVELAKRKILSVLEVKVRNQSHTNL